MNPKTTSLMICNNEPNGEIVILKATFKFKDRMSYEDRLDIIRLTKEDQQSLFDEIKHLMANS